MAMNITKQGFQAPWAQWITEKTAVLMKNGFYIIGVFSILALDILTGPIFLGNFNTTNSNLISATFWTISFALSAVQMIFWDYAVHRSQQLSLGDWRAWTPFVIVGLLMAVDTMLDIGFVTQLLYPGSDAFKIIPEHPPLIWWGLAVTVGLISLFCEVLLMWLLGRTRASGAGAGDEDLGVPNWQNESN